VPRFYGLLLRLYPSAFRSEYAGEMGAIFAERRRAVSGWRVAALWAESVVDVVRHAAPLHADVLRQDVRWALRSLRRAPGFAAAVILVTALGVGANTAVFTVTDVVLVRPLPYAEPDRLVRVWEHLPGYTRTEASPANFRDWRETAGSLESMSAYTTRSANLVGAGEPVRVEGVAATWETLPLLGIEPAVGRWFAEEDDRTGAPGTVLLSHSLWQREFGGDPGIVGRTIRLDDEAHLVLGVMPRAFAFPRGDVEYWTPMRFRPGAFEDRNDNFLYVVARLGPGVSLEQAREEMRLVAARLEAAYPVENENAGVTVNRVRDEVPAQARLLLVALLGASLCVLLIACTNLGNLLLVRGLSRRREMAVRASLGAGRERLVRQLLTESLVLAALGGALGVGAAWLALPLLGRLIPASIPVSGLPGLDLRVLLFAFAVTAGTGIGFGALPALRAGGRAGFAALREGARSGGARGARVRAGLVVVELTASVALLISAGLLIRSLGRLQAIDPGFRAEGVLTLRTWLPWPRYAPTAARAAYYQRVLGEVRALPGVEAAAWCSFLPIAFGGGIFPVVVGGSADRSYQANRASLRFITPDWFRALGVPLRRGRDVRESDTRESTFVAVVSESFAARHWPGQDPIGRTFQMAFFERTVVGVVGDVQVRGLGRAAEPQVYLPYLQVPDSGVVFYAPKDLAVRAARDPLALAPAIRDIIRRADPELAISNEQLLEDIVRGDTAPRRIQLRILGSFAAIAFLLAGIGIYGLLSFTVSRRAHEIGVRLALGARRRTILVMVLREGAGLAAAGTALGSVLGYGAGRAMRALLEGIAPADGVTFAAAIGLALLMAFVGTLLPALRAARVEPTDVIRAG
jgi:predicted permease